MRPIDADDAIHQIDMGKDGYNIAFLLQNDSYTSGAFDAIDHDISVLKAAPTLDAVPVVRCKDCKYYKSEKLERIMGSVFFTCPATGGMFGPDDYCSDGERREDDD